MKAAWNVITLIALANMIAIVGFVWWLHFSGRLDMDRVESVRAMLSETIVEQNSRELEAAAQAEQASIDAAEIERLSGPPVSAQDALALRMATSEIDLQRLQRLRGEVDDLKATLARERRMFDRDRAAFEADRTEFEEMREEIAEIEGDAQFAKSVEVLDTLKSAEAMEVLAELYATDPVQVVTYLDAMDSRARANVIREFNKDGQTDMAAGLLEALRLHGLEAGGQ